MGTQSCWGNAVAGDAERTSDKLSYIVNDRLKPSATEPNRSVKPDQGTNLGVGQ